MVRKGGLRAVIIGLGAIAVAGLGLPADAQPRATRNADKRVALVVGNSAYQHIGRLANPANDARLIAATLQGLGFTLVGGGPQLDLDKPGFDRAVQSFGYEVTGAGVALFYYAGHGLQVRGTNWLVPTTANPMREADVDFQMVDANLVLRQMEAAGTRLNLMILDACRNNPFGARGFRSASSGLATMQAPEGTLISYATQPGNVALDGNDGNSPFTKALAEALRRPGLDVFRLFNVVGLDVKRLTGGSQQPWVSSSPIDGDFYFAGAPGGTAPVVSAPPPPPSSAVDAEVVFWQSIATSTNPADFQAYLQQYPNGRFAPLARVRVQGQQQVAVAPLPATTNVPPGTIPAVAVAPAPSNWRPRQAVRVIVPTVTSTLADHAARAIASEVSGRLGQPIIVENRPGNDGTSGSEVVARAATDGHTLLVATHGTLVVTYLRTGGDPIKSFSPVGLIANTPYVVVVPATSSTRSLSDLVRKGHGGGFKYASLGRGSVQHLAAELFAESAGVRGSHVPYSAWPSALVDVIGGQVDAMFAGVIALEPEIQKGRLRALAILGMTRSPLLPQVPTSAEAGFPAVQAGSWVGVFAPPNVASDIVNAWNAALQGAQPSLTRRFAEVKLEPAFTSPDQFAEFLSVEVQKWGQVMRTAGVR